MKFISKSFLLAALLLITASAFWWEITWLRISMLILLSGLILGIFRWQMQTIAEQKHPPEAHISEQVHQQAEKALQKANSTLTSVIESPKNIVIFALDRHYRYIAFNTNHKNVIKRIWNKDIEAGMNMLELILREDDRAKAKENFDKVLKGEELILTEEYGAPPSRFWYENIYNPIVDDNGNVIGLSVFLTDITPRKRYEEALEVAKEAAEAANLAKSTFLANMSHELRSPLNAILGFAQIMDRNRAMPPEEKESLAIIRRSGEHLLNLINDVLDMSKIEAGRIVLNEKDFDVYGLLDDVEDMLCLKAEEKGLQLFFECDAGIPQYVRTDEGKLRQVLVNLINNAVKFTKKGSISVRVMPLPAENRETKKIDLQFEVKDTGEGIASEELDSLFEAFVQSETGRKSLEGTGLGLPISRKFVQMMGGDITVESEVGKGTVFRFHIQAEALEEAVIETAHPERRVIALEPDQPCYRILIVDDTENNRRLLLRLLALPGLELREAENGRDAVKIWEEWEPHLILMDMRMPVMDGYEAIKIIKKTTKGQATAIIAVTASVFEEERSVVLSAGCDNFVRKPFRDSEIFDVIRRHLGVRYVYEDDADSIVPGSSEKNMPKALTPEALDLLPSELIAELKQASLQGDTDRVEYLTEEIRSHNAALADELAALVSDFDYGKILRLIRG